MKNVLWETQTLRVGSSKVEPKIFAPPQIPFPGAQDGQNLISWRWSLPLPKPSLVKIDVRNFELSWYRTHKQTHKRSHKPTNSETGPIARAFRFAIRIDSLIHFKRIYSFCKKSAFRFTSCPAVFLTYLLQSPLKVVYSTTNIQQSKSIQSFITTVILPSRIKQVLN